MGNSKSKVDPTDGKEPVPGSNEEEKDPQLGPGIREIEDEDDHEIPPEADAPDR